MFYGEYIHTLDRKGRLIIPAKFRDTFKEQFIEKIFITRGLDGCLFVFTEEEWRLQENKFKTLPFTRPDARRFNRLFFSGAQELAIDKQGRILIPPYLKKYADIKRDLVLVGVSNRIEIWAQEKWDLFYDEVKGSFEDIAEKVLIDEE